MNCNWKIIYSKYEGPQKRALELISEEIGRYIAREPGIYSFGTVACEQSGDIAAENTIILGTYGDNRYFGDYLSPEDIPENGYVVRVTDNPLNPDVKLALICGYSPREVFYAAADFTDDYLTKAIPIFDSLPLVHELFRHKLPDYSISTAPKIKTRSIFTWGHPISDYREYFKNAARLRLNQVIVWNDFLPINSAEITEYAHSYGIELIWGFSWGWSTDCSAARLDDLPALKDAIIREYNEAYKKIAPDGIYFQSFTGLRDDTIGGKRISLAVTELVNMTAGELLKSNPGLKIQFGLHATSVREHLEDISRVDKRIEIIWEDCGSFPYKQLSAMNGSAVYDDTCEYEKNEAFTDKISSLRGGEALGLVYKCQVTMDWSRNRFKHQAGHYIMGKAHRKTIENDTVLLKPMWHFFQSDWLENGINAYRLTRRIQEKTAGNVNMCMAGMFSGGIWFPTALCAQIFWDCHEPYEEILKKVTGRGCVEMV